MSPLVKKRIAAVKTADAINAIEGAPISSYARSLSASWARGELTGEFCRGCGYCLPCPAGIQINQCARISLMIRRAPSESWLAPAMQAEMEKIEHCLGCGQCKSRCPYELDTPNLLKRNLADYRRILAGEVSTESYLRPAQK